MAKNLKINIKNTQLAQALKLGQAKKPAVKKKKEAAPDAAQISPAADLSPPEAVKSTPVTELKSTEKPFDSTVRAAKPDMEQEEPKAKPVEKPPSAAKEELTRPAAEQGATPPSPSQPRESGYPPRREGGYSSQPRESGYPPRREGGYSSQPREGGYPPRREGGYSSPPREGGYPPRREGGYSSQPREGGYPPRREGGYPSQPREGGYSSQPREGGYPPRREGGYPPRPGGYSPPSREGGYSSQPREGGYPPRREGGFSSPPREGGYPPRREGGYPPRPGGGYAPRPPGQGPRPGGYAPRPGGYTPRIPGGAPPSRDIKEPLRTEKGGKSPQRLEEPRKTPTSKDMREHKPQARKQSDSGFDSRDRLGLRDLSEDQGWRKRRPQKMRHIEQEEIIRPKSLKVRIPITLKDLAAEMKLKASQLISKLFMKGVTLTLNDYLDDETTVQLLGQDFDCEISIDTAEEDRLRITDKTIKQEISESTDAQLLYRPPVVAFMGHVDHGKTSLIDAIRKTNTAQGEAGAITQHIGAFKCHTDAGDITILDTPGHEAFSAMRARGADVTDIVVLVVAGDEGVKPQTVEALEQARSANVPIVVALSKCDKPNFDADTVYRQLADKNLLPETWGGQTITVNCSAVTGAGIKDLLEMLALQAEVLELKANPDSRARGTVIESEMHKGMGHVATILVQNGTLRLGDAIVFAQHYARVKTMQDEFGKDLTEAGPSTPIKITGLSGLPDAGSEFIVVKNEKEAMEIAEKRSEGKRYAFLQQTKRSGMESLLSEKASGIQKKYLNLILRADVQGSLEALRTSLLKIETQKVELNIISAAVGEISESDVQLASASKATLIGFHTQVESHAESLIKQLKITVKLHDIIYHAVDDVREKMTQLLDKIPQETDVGSAEVKLVFKASQLGNIAGCMVTDGTIRRGCHVRQVRDKQVIWRGPIASLKRVKEDIREASKGYECGIVLQNNSDVKVGDIFQAYEITYLEQEL